MSLRTSVRKTEDAAVNRLDMNRLKEQMEEATAMGRAGATERTGQAGRPFPHYGDTIHSLLHTENLSTYPRNTKSQRCARQDLSLEDAVTIS